MPAGNERKRRGKEEVNGGKVEQWEMGYKNWYILV